MSIFIRPEHFSKEGVELTRGRLSQQKGATYSRDWYQKLVGQRGHYRGKLDTAKHHYFCEDSGATLFDQKAVAALLKTRLRQRADLMKELSAKLSTRSVIPGKKGKSK